MMTLKIVIWPFWQVGNFSQPKIEIREYPIL